MASFFATTSRILKLAVHLVRGELARGPRAFWHLVTETFRTLRGSTGSAAHPENPVVVAAERAERPALVRRGEQCAAPVAPG